MFTISSVLFLALLAAIALSPFGGTIIGGAGAKPLLGRWRWFAVTLCTTIATGLLFWGVAEPLFHINETPKLPGLQPGSAAAAPFAISPILLKWTLTPHSNSPQHDRE